MPFTTEIVWNREFDWVAFGKSKDTLEEAKAFANAMLDSGDGARVKKARVLDNDTGEIVWPRTNAKPA